MSRQGRARRLPETAAGEGNTGEGNTGQGNTSQGNTSQGNTSQGNTGRAQAEGECQEEGLIGDGVKYLTN